MDVLSFFKGGHDEVAEALLAAGPCEDDTALQMFFEDIGVDHRLATFDDVTLVEGNDQGDAELLKLSRQIETAFKIRSINHIDDHVDVLTLDDISGLLLVLGVGIETVGPGQIDDENRFTGRIIPSLEECFLLRDRNTRPVSYTLKFTCERVEHRRLTAVGVTGKRYFHHNGFTLILSASVEAIP